MCEAVSLSDLASKYGTPLYVYSQETMVENYRRLDESLGTLDHLICFAMKANSNLAILKTFADLGSGFDVVSGGELQRVVAAGGDPGKCVFAGVGKTAEEIRYALTQGIYSFNVESEVELSRINRIAGEMKKVAPVAIRVNPNVDAKTHAKITTGTYENKFGIPFEDIPALYQKIAKMPHVKALGVQMHIGSQLTQISPFVQAVEKMVPLVKLLKEQHALEFFSIGGGIGIIYQEALASGEEKWWTKGPGKRLLTPERYAKNLVPKLKGLGLKILLEPGRYMVGNAGALITRVEFIKETARKHFVVVDAAMNDLIRPAFYEAFHEILPLKQARGKKLIASDVVGPICESGDTFCKDRPLPPVKEGDFLALLSAGAYGFVMASNYNTRPLAAEVLVNGNQQGVVRKRQTLEQLWEGESLPSWKSKKLR